MHVDNNCAHLICFSFYTQINKEFSTFHEMTETVRLRNRNDRKWHLGRRPLSKKFNNKYTL